MLNSYCEPNDGIKKRNHFQFKRNVLILWVCTSDKRWREKIRSLLFCRRIIKRQERCSDGRLWHGWRQESWSPKVLLWKSVMWCSCVPTTLGWNKKRRHNKKQEIEEMRHYKIGLFLPFLSSSSRMLQGNPLSHTSSSLSPLICIFISWALYYQFSLSESVT